MLLLATSVIFAQGTIKGTVTDPETNMPLPGANVMVAGTSNGTTTDFDGMFTLEVDQENLQGKVVVTYVGFLQQEIPFNIQDGETLDLGEISLQADENALGEIVLIGKGVIDLEQNRKTPIAVSTIKKAEIQAKAVGNVEFPEVMKNTPSVYVSDQAGGFGESQMFLRGFDQTNTAFLLNGQPINGMEDGRMYWSNWAGMSDVANAVQVQRGLGSSKLAISSVGGTVNIVSKSAERREGGFTRFMTGNDSYLKGTVGYDSGLQGKWAFSFMLDHWQAHRKYAEGTEGQGQNYFFAVGFVPNERHSLNFLITGAPQTHGQNFSVGLDQYEEFGIKHNNLSGFKDGERFTIRKNYYHKPVANLNWDWDINEKLDLSSVLYASWGRGGGTGPAGDSDNIIYNDRGGIDFDAIVDQNQQVGVGGFGNALARRMSVNMHNWYGLLSNLNFEPNENWSLNIGFDGRLYKGDHFYQMNDLLGLTAYTDNYGYGSQRPSDYRITETFDANPWSALFNKADPDQRFNYDYSENINYLGTFGQAEYVNEGFSAFIQGAVSTQSYQREGRAEGNTIEGVDGLGESEKVNKTGFNIKGGLGYEITDGHIVFANAGYYSRQPYLDNIFDDVRNSNYILEGSDEVDNEEITGFEAGYRFNTSNFALDINAYHTTWGNRFVSGGFIPGDETSSDPVEQVDRYQRFTDVTQVHQGIELEARYRINNLMLRAYGSIGDWKYDGSTPAQIRDNETNELLDETSVDLKGTYVGNAPQNSFGVGFKYDFLENFSIDADLNYYDKLYGFVDAQDVIESSLVGETYQSELLNSYFLLDAGLSYTIPFEDNKRSIVFRGNVYNVANHIYLNQKDSYGYYYGNGRTWNLSVRYNF